MINDNDIILLPADLDQIENDYTSCQWIVIKIVNSTYKNDVFHCLVYNLFTL